MVLLIKNYLKHVACPEAGVKVHSRFFLNRIICGRETDRSAIPPVRTRRAQLMQRAQDGTLLLLTFRISDEQFEL